MIEKVKETRDFVEESWAELQKVTWPDYEQLQQVTIVIIIFSIAVSLIIWLMDIASRTVIDFILRIFGGA